MGDLTMNVVEALTTQFGAAVTALAPFRGEQTVIVEAGKIAEVARFLHDTAGFDFLSDIAAVDYYTPQNPEPEHGRFALCYHLLSIRWNSTLRLKVYWSEGDAPVPSVTPIWKSANWEEREAYDMFGISFAGHPDPRRLLMPDDWQGYPGRKDYPLGYETVQFSFNFDEVNKHKPYAKE